MSTVGKWELDLGYWGIVGIYALGERDSYGQLKLKIEFGTIGTKDMKNREGYGVLGSDLYSTKGRKITATFDVTPY